MDNLALKPGQNNGLSPLAPTKASTNPAKNVNPNILTQGQAYAGGIVNYDTSTGQKLATGATTLKTPIATQSTTTLSSDKTSDILANNNNLINFANKGITTDPASGVASYADGSVYTPTDYGSIRVSDAPGVGERGLNMLSPEQEYQSLLKQGYTLQNGVLKAPITKKTEDDAEVDPFDTSAEDARIEANFAQMKANTDAVTAAQISSIQEKYKRLKEEQAKINESTLGATRQSLIQSGAMRGDVFADDNIQLRLEQNQNKIKDLEAEETDLINTARAAQLLGDNRILELKNAQIAETRAAKQEAAAKLNEELIEANKKARERSEEMERDTAVADIYAQGITDVPTILSTLKEAGYSMTSKEVADTLKNIVPAGLDDLVKTLRTNGAPQEVIQSVLSSPDINSAYANAGSWAAGGTGIIGEYNLYKAQAEAAGQVPIDFNAFQDIDANRKKSIARAGVASTTGSTSGKTYDSAQEKIIVRVDKDIANSPTYKRTVSMRAFAENVESALSQGTGVGDIAAINQFQKVIDEGAVTRDQDVKLIQGAQSLANTLSTKIKKLTKGEQLSPELRQQMLKTVQDILKAQEQAISKDPFIKSKKNELDRNKIDPMDSILGELEQAESSSNLVETGAEAKTAIDTAFDTFSSEVQNMIISSYENNLSDIDIYNQLKDRGLIK